MGEGPKRARAATKRTRKAPMADALLALFNVATRGVGEERRQAALNVILRAASATVAHSEAYAACMKSRARRGSERRAALYLDEEKAQDECRAAGAALAKALRGVK